METSHHSAARDSFYRLGNAAGRSNTSLESEALLDHRYIYEKTFYTVLPG